MARGVSPHHSGGDPRGSASADATGDRRVSSLWLVARGRERRNRNEGRLRCQRPTDEHWHLPLNHHSTDRQIVALGRSIFTSLGRACLCVPHADRPSGGDSRGTRGHTYSLHLAPPGKVLLEASNPRQFGGHPRTRRARTATMKACPESRLCGRLGSDRKVANTGQKGDILIFRPFLAEPRPTTLLRRPF